jgi:hypothetical protein
LLTAIGLPPGGSSTVHIYIQTMHRTTQRNRIYRTYITISNINITIRIHNLKNRTKHTTIYTMMKNGIKRTWKNVINENAIQAANFVWSIYLLITLDTLLLRPSHHFTTLHYTYWHFTSFHLNFTQLHLPTISFVLNPFKFLTAQFHLTSLHLT